MIFAGSNIKTMGPIALLLFEAMDKVFSLTQIWTAFGIAGVAGFFIVRRIPIALPVFLIFVGALGYMILEEIHDPFVGADIIREAGSSYALQSYVAITLGALGPMVGLLDWIRRKVVKPA
jgi:hypothetical protein